MTDHKLATRWGYLLKHVQADLRTRMDAALGDVGLTASQYAALANLEEAPGLSNAELARRSFVTPQTMVRIVTALEQRGLVVRTPRPGNARILDAELTRAGRAAVLAGRDVVGTVEREMSDRLTSEQQATLVDLLTALLER
jgi:DNA-binding MarR family transcriptional regulator